MTRGARPWSPPPRGGPHTTRRVTAPWAPGLRGVNPMTHKTRPFVVTREDLGSARRALPRARLRSRCELSDPCCQQKILKHRKTERQAKCRRRHRRRDRGAAADGPRGGAAPRLLPGGGGWGGGGCNKHT